MIEIPTLYRTAEEFVEQKFRGANEVLGVLLTGSAASSYPDAGSDIDLEVIATENQCMQIGDTCGFEHYHDVDISWEWVTLKELENELKDWKDDVDLWVYSRSKVLHDTRRGVEAILSEYKQYPTEVWRDKLFLYWFFATGSVPLRFW
jgi:hypothetical protein